MSEKERHEHLKLDQLYAEWLTSRARHMSPDSNSWKPPKTSQFWRVCDSIRQVCVGGRRCAVRRDFSMLTSG